jgi:AhpD family alkylhydroperoxidase
MAKRSNKQPQPFNKRIYSLSTFIEDARAVILNMDDLRTAARGGRVSRAFAEKIMLVVSQVNGCRYCTYGHTRAALAAGVSEAELQKLFRGEFGEFPKDEVVALTFSQHYAESHCQPDPLAWQRVVDFYGEQTARDILAYLRMITFGNLLGNTFDALLSRLAGRPAPGSRLLDEMGVLLGAVVVLPIGIVLRLLNRWLSGVSRTRTEAEAS